MIETLQNVLNELISWVAATTGLSVAVLVNVVVLSIVAAFIIWRVREEVRSGQWSRLAPQERRALIWTILNEAYDYAEWLYSHLGPVPASEKEQVGQEKKQAAVEYAKRELRALGASMPDVMTVPTRIETVVAERKGGQPRYSRSSLKGAGTKAVP